MGNEQENVYKELYEVRKHCDFVTGMLKDVVYEISDIAGMADKADEVTIAEILQALRDKVAAAAPEEAKE